MQRDISVPVTFTAVPRRSTTATASGARTDHRAPADARVFTDILLPIKTEFVELMRQGAKSHEYRKYRVRDTVVRFWLYETAPASHVRWVVAAMVPEGSHSVLERSHAHESSYIIRTGPAKVPGEVHDSSGIGNDDFDAGLKVSKFGYPVEKVYKLPAPITAHELRATYGLGVPQSYCFITHALLEAVNFGDDASPADDESANVAVDA